MSQARNYRSYPGIVKQEVSRTGNIYLFPDLKIPRSTAQYWVERKVHARSNTITEFESVYKKKSEYLLKELEKEKALRRLLEEVKRIFPFDFQKKHVKNKTQRSQIVAAIRECIKLHTLSRCLQAIGLSSSAYKRWSSELSFCKQTKGLCQRRKASQLTDKEVWLMKKFVSSRKYAHVSIASLHLLAQRLGELFCSVETWYKYIRCHEWKRPWSKKKAKFLKIGIRASRSNEIWHIDVTEVNVRPGFKLFIQAVVDNFSRFVLAWRVTESISALSTVETLNQAREKAAELLSRSDLTTVMMDPGKENDNKKVMKFISSKNLLRSLARVDIHFSNSMIESLFRMLKNNYLYHQGIHGIADLIRKADFYFNQHNNVIPLASKKGARPFEVFVSSWGEEHRLKLQSQKQAAWVDRKMKNMAPPCEICPSV